MKSEGKPKFGRHGPKARTGCLTCKRRKVKCDEQKPTCCRCEKSGYECEGYVLPKPILHPREKLVDSVLPPLLAVSPLLTKRFSNDVHYRPIFSIFPPTDNTSVHAETEQDVRISDLEPVYVPQNNTIVNRLEEIPLEYQSAMDRMGGFALSQLTTRGLSASNTAAQSAIAQASAIPFVPTLATVSPSSNQQWQERQQDKADGVGQTYAPQLYSGLDPTLFDANHEPEVLDMGMEVGEMAKWMTDGEWVCTFDWRVGSRA